MSDCRQDSLNDRCTCTSRYTNDGNSRVYDFASKKFVCCGHIGYDINSTYTDPSNTATGNNKYLNAAAMLDNAICKTNGWWDNVPGTDFTKGISSREAGPNDDIIDTLKRQKKISALFPLADQSYDTVEEKMTYSCTDVESSLNVATVPRYLSYLNPNLGDMYIKSVVCAPKGSDNYVELKTRDEFETEDFALFKIDGCSTSTNADICSLEGSKLPYGGEMDIKSKKYNGPSKLPKKVDSTYTPEQSFSNTRFTQQIAIVVGIILVIVLFAVLIILYYRADRQSESFRTVITTASR